MDILCATWLIPSVALAGFWHFAIARGSAMECAAVLDVVRALGALQDEQYRQAVELWARVVDMLTKLCR